MSRQKPLTASWLRRSNRMIVVVGDQLSWIYLFIVVISVYEVAMRYVFNRPTTWVHETSLYLAGAIMVYGGLYAFAKDKHIAIAVVTDLLPGKIQRIFYLLADVITFLYIILLTVSTILMTREAVFAPDGRVQLERSGSSWNSVFPVIVKISMSVFLLMFLLLVAVHVIAKCSALIKGQEEPQGSDT